MRVQFSLFFVYILLFSLFSFSSVIHAENQQQQRAEERVAKFAGAVANLLRSVDEKGWTKVLKPLVNRGIDYCVNGLNAMLAPPPEHQNL